MTCPLEFRLLGPLEVRDGHHGARNSSTRSSSVCGPRELLNTTSYPPATANRATVPPMLPLPMKPTVAIAVVRGAAKRGLT